VLLVAIAVFFSSFSVAVADLLFNAVAAFRLSSPASVDFVLAWRWRQLLRHFLSLIFSSLLFYVVLLRTIKKGFCEKRELFFLLLARSFFLVVVVSPHPSEHFSSCFPPVLLLFLNK
jgi:hypothetical protein